ncbi:MAG: hypothetical protein HY253_13815 [Burkholderiales bacterium]|nr:hypothetical protein [Burkholderiales bacterium]
MAMPTNISKLWRCHRQNMFASVVLLRVFLPLSTTLHAQNSKTANNQYEIKNAKRVIAELEEKQDRLIRELRTYSATSSLENKKEIEGVISSIDGDTAKTYISPSTDNIRFAMYYKSVSRKIEKIGTCYFPTVNGKKIYGALILAIPIFLFGSIYEKDGGVLTRIQN